MVIDFHTHIFPDKIAKSTIEHLESAGNSKAFTGGTYDELLKSMKEGEVDISVVLPVVTKPSQFESINAYAAKITGKNGLISFGGIHPDSEKYREELDKIKELGLLGIKLHPDYQKTYIDDEKYVNIIQYATDIGLIVSIHAGLDIGLPDPIHCTPERSFNMLKQIKGNDKKIILAHVGGFKCWDDVERLIVGQDVYMDIGYCLNHISDEQFVRIVKNHGADKMLFATDSPWSGQKETIEYLKKLPFTKEELEMIFYKNAEKLLKLK